MLLSIHPDNPDPKKIKTVLECLKDGGVIIYPTDAVYSIGCSLLSKKGIERVAKIKGIKPEKANFSLVCSDMSHLSDFVLPLDNSAFKLMKKNLPGPFTFILNASTLVPKIFFKTKKKTVGIRIPNHNIPNTLVEQLGNPLISTSVHDTDEIIEYTTDPELIYENYGKQVDIVIDGGFGNIEATAIIDCTDGAPEIIREGIKEIIW